MPRVKAMLEAGPLDGAAVGEAVEPEAAEVEVGVEGDASIVSVSVAISPANSSCFAEWSRRGLGARVYPAAAWAAAPLPSSSPGVREGAGDRPATAAEASHEGVLPWRHVGEHRVPRPSSDAPSRGLENLCTCPLLNGWARPLLQASGERFALRQGLRALGTQARVLCGELD